MDTILEPRKAWGQCWIVSSRVAQRDGTGIIQAAGYNYERRSHYANWDPATDTVTDHTMRQFDRHCPAPWVGIVDEWVDKVREHLNDDLNIMLYHGIVGENDDGLVMGECEEMQVVWDHAEPGPMPMHPGLSDEIDVGLLDESDPTEGTL
jgi:hypothetical protein